MTIRKAQDLQKGATYVVRSTVSGQVGCVFQGRFRSELAFRTASGEWWTVPVAYFVSADPA